LLSKEIVGGLQVTRHEDSRHNCRRSGQCGARAPPRASLNHPSIHPLKLTADDSYQQLTTAVCSRMQLKTLKTGPIHLVWPIIQEGVWFSVASSYIRQSTHDGAGMKLSNLEHFTRA
jgi:hypothetical protein